MKTYKNIKIIIVFSFAILMSYSCTDGFEEMNIEKNLVTEDLVNVNLIFTRVLMRAVKQEGRANGTGTIGNYSGMSYSGSNRPFLEGDAPEIWDNTYERYTNNLSEIIRLTKDDPDLINKTAIARIMKVWAFAKVTDTYGDIPYFQSSLPQSEVIYNPSYDTQQSIYEDFFIELKEAASSLNASMESFGSADLVYGGDVEKWRKFANSLRLRLALRVRYVDEAMARDNMSDLQASDLILTRADDASMYTVVDGNNDNWNPFYNGVINSGTDLNKRTAGAFIIKMKEFNDPRIKIYADTARATFPEDDPNIDYFGYRGRPVLGLVPIEYKLPWGQETSSEISDLWYVPEIEIPILRSSEVHFALAEAALFGLKAGNAQDHYKAGMEDAMAWAKDFYENAKPQLPNVLGQMYEWSEDDIALLISHKEITMAESDAFLASPVATLSGSPEEQFEQIIVQKNIALYPMEYQNWSEWRRTGYPVLQIGPDNDDLKGVIPRRMPWPNIEQTINGNSYDEAESRIGSDERLSKFWWDANPNVPYPWTGAPLPTMDTTWVDVG